MNEEEVRVTKGDFSVGSSVGGDDFNMGVKKGFKNIVKGRAHV